MDMRINLPERPAPALTMRQAQVLCLLANGYSNKKIARELDIGPETVKSHITAATRNMGARNRIEAVAKAAKRGIF